MQKQTRCYLTLRYFNDETLTLITNKEQQESRPGEEEGGGGGGGRDGIDNEVILVNALLSFDGNGILKEISLLLPEVLGGNYHSLSFESLQTLSIEENSIKVSVLNSFDFSEVLFREPSVVRLLKSHLSKTQKKNAISTQQFYGTKSQTIFSIFPRQELAFEYYDQQISLTQQHLKVFSFESITGKRKFLVCDMNSFPLRYQQIPFEKRHVYEIIRDQFPCRLYFDIEYSKTTNPTALGEVLMEHIISLVICKVHEFFGLKISSRNFIQLDSSTAKKFSRHLILHLKRQDSDNDDSEYLFKNNIEVGNFVFALIESCLAPIPETPVSAIPLILPRQFRHLTIQDTWSQLWLLNSEGTERVCVIDTGVYTRNRAFRLLQSSKFGKQAHFSLLHQTVIPEDFCHSISQEDDISTIPISTEFVSIVGDELEEMCLPRFLWNPLELRNPLCCFEKRKIDYLDQLNSLAKMDKLAPRYQDVLSQKLEKSFVIPSSIISPLDKLPSSFRLLTSLDAILIERSFCFEHQGFSLESYQCTTDPIPHFSRISVTWNKNASFIELDPLPYSSYVPYSHLNYQKGELTNPIEIVSCKRINDFGKCESPFQIIDEHVVHIAGLHPHPQLGPIRITQWTLKSCAPIPLNSRNQENGTFQNVPPVYSITYQVSGTKYCYRIGRHHKSNHIMFEVNLNQGQIVQKCWDPDCRGFKSAPFYIPHRALPPMDEILEVIGDIVLTLSIQHQGNSIDKTNPPQGS